MHPSHALYQSLQSAYEHFNRELFDEQLPAVIFTVQRHKDVMGYFAPERWAKAAKDAALKKKKATSQPEGATPKEKKLKLAKTLQTLVTNEQEPDSE